MTELELAEQIKKACIRAALDGYEDASIRGLCHEGAWEAALSAVDRLEPGELLSMAASQHSPAERNAGPAE